MYSQTLTLLATGGSFVQSVDVFNKIMDFLNKIVHGPFNLANCALLKGNWFFKTK